MDTTIPKLPNMLRTVEQNAKSKGKTIFMANNKNFKKKTKYPTNSLVKGNAIKFLGPNLLLVL